MAGTTQRWEAEQPVTPRSGKLQRAGASVGARLGNAVAASFETSRIVARSVRDGAQTFRARAERVKDEKPLQSLAFLAGLGMAAGLAIRIWRSHRHA